MVGLLLRRIGCTTVSWEAENAIGSLGSRDSPSSLDSRGIRVSSETRRTGNSLAINRACFVAVGGEPADARRLFVVVIEEL